MRNGLARIGHGLVAGITALSLGLQGAGAQQVIDAAAAAAVADTMARALQATEDGLLTMDRSRWDPQWLADELAADPEALRLFLRQNVLWVPYAGALRGAEGVLQDRVAGSLDGALAMAALLQAAGYPVRLARAPLPPEAVAALLAPAPPEPAPLPAEIVAEPLVAAAETYGLDPAAVAAGLAPGLAATDTFEATLQVAAQGARLLGETGLPESPAPEPDLAAALADHWWAQFDDGTGWQDADWLTADGRAPATAAEVMAPADLPADLYHRVRLVLSVEQVDQGAALVTTLTEAEFVPALGQGRDITLTHMPMNWPADWAAAGPEEVQKRLRAAFASQTEWWPILTADGTPLGPVSVRADGSINPDPAPSMNPFLPLGVGAAGDLVAAADALRIGDEGAETLPGGASPEPTGQFTAEWLDFTVTAPGQPDRSERRAIFDVIGPAARAAGAEGGFVITDEARALRSLGAMSETTIRIFPAQPAPDWLLYQSAAAVLASKPALDAVAADPFGKVPSDLSAVLSGLAPGPGPIEAFAASRTALNPFGSAVYQDRPLIVALHSGYARDKASGDFLVEQALDIVDAGMGVMPGTLAQPFVVRLMQGVADARAESDALGGAAAGNAGTAFDPSDPAWRMIRSPADLPPDAPPDMAAQITAALAEGQIAFAPLADPSSAAAQTGSWWRIDPATGETLAMGPKGWGQAMVEWAFLLILKTLWAQIACMARVAAIRAASEAFDKGRVTLPKTRAELKAGTTDVAKACVREALLNQLTGMTAMIFVGLPGYGMAGLNNWAVGSGGWSAAPSTLGRLPGRGPGSVDPLATTQAGVNPLAPTQLDPRGGGGASGGGASGGGSGGGTSPKAGTVPPAAAPGGTSPKAGTLPPAAPPGAPSPKAGTIPPGTPPGAPPATAAKPAAPPPSPALQKAAENERLAAEEARRAKLAHEANPTPETAAERARAFDALLNAGRDKVAVWDGREQMPHVVLNPATGGYEVTTGPTDGPKGSASSPAPAPAPVDPMAATQVPPGGPGALEQTLPLPGGPAALEKTLPLPPAEGAVSPMATTQAGGGFAATLAGLGALQTAIADP